MSNNNTDLNNSIKSMLEDNTRQAPSHVYTPPPPPTNPKLYSMGVYASVVLSGFGLLALVQSVGVGLLILGISIPAVLLLIDQRDKAVEAQKNYQSHHLAELNHFHAMDKIRLQQRADAMNALKDVEVARMGGVTGLEAARIQANAQVEVAKYQAFGVKNDREFILKSQEFTHQLETEEARKVREHEASESQKDRDLAMTRLITELQGKIDVIEARLKYENPSAHAESMEELVRMKGEMAQIQEIQKLENEDPVLYKQVLNRFLQNRYKRGA